MFLGSASLFASAIFILKITTCFSKSVSNPGLQEQFYELRIVEVNQTQALEELRSRPNITNLKIYSVYNPFIFRNKVELKNLKNFVLIFENHFNKTHSFWTDSLVGSRILEDGIPFTKNGQTLTLDNILDMKVNIDIRSSADLKPILKINHTTAEIVSRYTSTLNPIFNGGSILGLKKLSVGDGLGLSNEPISIPRIPNTLRDLQLDVVELTDGTLNELLKNLTVLKNLFLAIHDGSGNFSLSSIPKSLENLVLLYVTKMEYDEEIELPNLESLYIYEVSYLDPKIIQNIDKIFPRLKYTVFWQYQLELLSRVASIPSIEEITLTNYDNDQINIVEALTTNPKLQQLFGPFFKTCVRNGSECYLQKVDSKWVPGTTGNLSDRFCQFDLFRDVCEGNL